MVRILIIEHSFVILEEPMKFIVLDKPRYENLAQMICVVPHVDQDLLAANVSLHHSHPRFPGQMCSKSMCTVCQTLC